LIQATSSKKLVARNEPVVSGGFGGKVIQVKMTKAPCSLGAPFREKGCCPRQFPLRRARHSGSVLTMTTSHHQLCIGVHISGEPVMLDPEERRRHLYLVGQTGTGKSTVLLNLIRQDLIAGEGLALLDPHGDLAEAVLAHIPRARTNDLVYINPADAERPIGFNPLACIPDDLKPVVADGVVSAFRHVWPDNWGPRLDYILINAVRALLDVPGATLLMLPRLLIDDQFRSHIIAHHVGDPVVRAFWLNQYAAYSPSFRTEAIAPIQNKIGRVLIEPRLRNMLAQSKNTITLRRLMDEGAIVICNLSKGGLGEGTAHLLGALLTTAFAQAALSRADTPAALRRPFHLYGPETK
jgi:Helicase HerA, central domain